MGDLSLILAIGRAGSLAGAARTLGKTHNTVFRNITVIEEKTGVRVEALNEAAHKFGRPEIMNTDQGSQFTSFAWTDRLRRMGVRISMDGEGRFLDNIFAERLWRTLKYECANLHAGRPDHRPAPAFENGWSSTTRRDRIPPPAANRPP